MSFDISDKTVLVTGATSGLGRHLAMALLQDGANVIIHGRNDEKLRKTMESFRDFENKTASVLGDISKPEDCRNIIRDSLNAFGRLDILINNAGTGSSGLLADTLPLATRKVIEPNLLGTIYMTHYAIPHIVRTRGSIILISSLAGLYGLPYRSIYCISKMALTALAQALRIELSGSGVHTGIMYVGALQNSPEKRIIECRGKAVHPTRKPGKNAMSMDKASTIIIHSIKKRKAKTVFSGLGKFLCLLNRISPLLVRTILSLSSIRTKFNHLSGQETGSAYKQVISSA